MLFNSLEFLIFLPIVLLIYYSLGHRKQNSFLVLASCVFYASWDWRFLLPLLCSTSIDYFCALGMAASIQRGEPRMARRPLMLLSAGINLALLGFFKYCNFFVDSLHAMLHGVGIAVPASTLDIILPVGISFYTFQALSYTIDVYRGEIHATRSFKDFFLAILFFPHLVAGPIQRASNLLSQVVRPRTVSRMQVIDGLNLIVWGYFKKVVIADRLAPLVNAVFLAPSPSGGETALAIFAFAIQIYCDFSGYTDIARGVAKLMGFEFTLNFNLPYFAVNPSDFWQRWHISLSSWLRDYLFIPLGGSKHGERKTRRNLMITMVLGGLWHGAAWNFVLWGFYHGALLVLHRSMQPHMQRILWLQKPWMQLPWKAIRMAVMFALTCYGWLLFRATSAAQIGAMTRALLHPLSAVPAASLITVLTLTAPLLIVQLLQLHSGRLDFYRAANFPRVSAPIMLGAMGYCVLFLGAQPQSFVYFQF